jgi:hypothetical protein
MRSRNAAIERFAASRQIGAADRRGEEPEIETSLELRGTLGNPSNAREDPYLLAS